MALKVVNTESLDAVADAINAKAGTSGALQFPDGFVSAVESISAGGGDEALAAKNAKLLKIMSGEYMSSPDNIVTADDLKGLTAIRDNLFKGVNLRSIDVPEGVTRIGDNAFSDNNGLSHCTLPNTLVSIGQYVWSSVLSLEELVIPDSVTTLGTWTFSYCEVKNLVLSKNLTVIPDNCIRQMPKIEKIRIPEGVTRIGSSGVGWNNLLTTIELPSTLKELGSSAFAGNPKLVNISLPSSLTKMSSYTFQAAAFTSMVIPDSVTTWSSATFYNCEALTSANIPKGVSRLENETFFGCISLLNMVIPSNITQINTGAFRNCKALEYVDLTEYGTDITFPTLANVNAFTNAGTNTTAGTFEIRVPSGRKAELSAMTNWSTYADNIVEV